MNDAQNKKKINIKNEILEEKKIEKRQTDRQKRKTDKQKRQTEKKDRQTEKKEKKEGERQRRKRRNKRKKWKQTIFFIIYTQFVFYNNLTLS